MRRAEAVLMTTHVDRQNERFTLGALESAVAQLESAIIPVGIEHDPRIPPHGRVISAEIRELDDGEFAVHGVVELFDPGEKIPLSPDRRSIAVPDYRPGAFRLSPDRNFRNPADQSAVRELETILRCQAKEDIKKALDPLSILTVGAGFALGAIAGGFLKELGADAYKAFKRKLIEIFARRTAADRETLLCFDFVLERGGNTVAVEAILTNPRAEDIERFLESGLRELDRLILEQFSPIGEIRRMVFEWKDGTVRVRFMVRRDAVPIFPSA